MPDHRPAPSDADQRVREIEARCRNATPAPWRYDLACGAPGERNGIWCGRYLDEEPGVCGDFSQAWPLVEHDASFIAHAREDIPWLLAERARLVAELETVRQANVAHVRRIDALDRLTGICDTVEIVDNIHGYEGYTIYGAGDAEGTGSTLSAALDAVADTFDTADATFARLNATAVSCPLTKEAGRE